MNEWGALHQTFDALVSSGSVEVREDGEWLAEFARFQWEFRGRGENGALIHLWCDGRNLTRRIVGVKEQSAERVIFEVQRLGRSKPGQLEFLRSDSDRP